MARLQKKVKTNKLRAPSRKVANALGYAKRQSSKSKVLSGGTISDVYEYQPEKVRRSKVKLQLEKDELIGAGGEGSGSDLEDDEGGRTGKSGGPRLVGEKEDDEEIDEDEDEDIDSDEAFEESDEERFAGFNFSHNVREFSFVVS